MKLSYICIISYIYIYIYNNNATISNSLLLIQFHKQNNFFDKNKTKSCAIKYYIIKTTKYILIFII